MGTKLGKYSGILQGFPFLQHLFVGGAERSYPGLDLREKKPESFAE